MSGERPAGGGTRKAALRGQGGQQKPWCPPSHPTVPAGPRALGAHCLRGKQAGEQWVPREVAGEA